MTEHAWIDSRAGSQDQDREHRRAKPADTSGVSNLLPRGAGRYHKSSEGGRRQLRPTEICREWCCFAQVFAGPGSGGRG